MAVVQICGSLALWLPGLSRAASCQGRENGRALIRHFHGPLRRAISTTTVLRNPAAKHPYSIMSSMMETLLPEESEPEGDTDRSESSRSHVPAVLT